MKFLKVFAVLAALTVAACASAAPFDVTAQFAPPVVDALHGPAESYRLYQGCRDGETKLLVGQVTPGQTFAGLLAANGTYSFCVHAVNATAEGPRSNIQVVNINDFDPAPGAPVNFIISVTCDASCSVNISSEQ
jgi:hypothetical protein